MADECPPPTQTGPGEQPPRKDPAAAETPALTAAARAAQAAREARSAAALRANLYKRKAQARARAQPIAPSPPDTGC